MFIRSVGSSLLPNTNIQSCSTCCGIACCKPKDSFTFGCCGQWHGQLQAVHGQVIVACWSEKGPQCHDIALFVTAAIVGIFRIDELASSVSQVPSVGWTCHTLQTKVDIHELHDIEVPHKNHMVIEEINHNQCRLLHSSTHECLEFL